VVNQTLVLHINVCGENRRLRKPQKFSSHFMKRRTFIKESFSAVVGILEKLGVTLFYSYTSLPNFSPPTTLRKSCLSLVARINNLPALF